MKSALPLPVAVPVAAGGGQTSNVAPTQLMRGRKGTSGSPLVLVRPIPEAQSDGPDTELTGTLVFEGRVTTFAAEALR